MLGSRMKKFRTAGVVVVEDTIGLFFFFFKNPNLYPADAYN